MLLFQVFHGLLLLSTVQDNAYPEKEENIFKLIGRSRNISSHSYRLLVSHSASDLTKTQPNKKKNPKPQKTPNMTYSKKVNFVSAKSAMTSSLLQQPLIPNASPTLTSKVILPAIPKCTFFSKGICQKNKIHFN